MMSRTAEPVRVSGSLVPSQTPPSQRIVAANAAPLPTTSATAMTANISPALRTSSPSDSRFAFLTRDIPTLSHQDSSCTMQKADRAQPKVRFKPLVTADDSNEHWRETDHDDLVLATALACWWARRKKDRSRVQLLSTMVGAESGWP